MSSDDTASRHLHFDLGGDMQEVMGRVKAVEAFLLETGCSLGCAQQMAVVAEEIFVNIITDAWPGREQGRCTVDVHAMAKDGSVEVTLRTEDDGVAFDPTGAESPDLDASLDDRPIGGVGILLIKSMTDAQVYRRTDGRNVFEVSKTCPLA